MSFFKSLFGGGKLASPDTAVKELDYNGFLIQAKPYKEGGQFQTAGTIAKTVEGARREHRFVRADRFASQEEAADFALSKGRQIVDEMGDRLFDQPAA